MTQMQRTLLSLGIAGITILCLCPPHQWERRTYIIRTEGETNRAGVIIENAGHHWIWDPPGAFIGEDKQGIYKIRVSNNVIIDWSRLGIYVGVIAGFTLFAAFVVFQKEE
jgi:hypothetical protein